MRPTLATLALLLPMLAHAASLDIAGQVQQAAHDANTIYGASGLAGLEAASRDCYKSRKSGFRCINLDVAAVYLDRRFASAVGIKRYAYFDATQFLLRARPIFAHAHWSMETSNKYLQFADSAVQGELNGASGGG